MKKSQEELAREERQRTKELRQAGIQNTETKSNKSREELAREERQRIKEEKASESKMTIETTFRELAQDRNFQQNIKYLVQSLKKSELATTAKNYNELLLQELKKAESDAKYKIDYKALNSYKKSILNSSSEESIKSLTANIDATTKNEQFEKLQSLFTLVRNLKNKEEKTSYSEKISKAFDMDIDSLKRIFNIKEDEEELKKSKESNKKTVNIQKIINSLPANNKKAIESNIKSLDTILSEITLGKDNEQNSQSTQNIKILKEQYQKVKKYSGTWQDKSATDIYHWAMAHKGKLDNEEGVYEAIAVMDRANNLISGGHSLRDTQILSVLAFLQTAKDQGKLCQINTGEGKTTIVALLAVIKALQGETVDIITSNPVLAEEGGKDKANFYGLFGLTVSTNNIEKDDKYIQGPKPCYSADILYGSISNFQFDYLRDSFEGLKTRGERKFGTVILDEVDSMLIDNGGHTAKISGPLPGMESLRYVYIKIWDALSKQKIENATDIHSIKQKMIQSFKIPEAEQRLIPEHLKQYANDKLPKWIKVAVDAAFHFHKDQQYDIKGKLGNGETSEPEENVITPVDYANTGVTLHNTIWSDALHQFVQLKEVNLRLTAESLTSSFISNLGYIHKYGNKIYGLTGTLGSTAEQDLLSTIYNIDYAKIPTYKEKKFKELPYLIIADKEWVNTVVAEALGQLEKGRACLIVCETKKDLKSIKEKLDLSKRLGKKIKIKLYTDEDDSDITKDPVNSGDVIIATNIAGRGTDLKTTSKLEENGGLHVCVGFLPNNKRVEDQAFGRTSRQGKDGTGQLIVRESEIIDLGIKNLEHIKYMKPLRDKAEEARIQNIKDKKVGELEFKDKLFEQFSELYKQLKDKNKEKHEFYYVLSDLKEYWAFWLERQETEGKKLTKELAVQKFKEFEADKKVQGIKDGKICHNPYYSINQAEYFLRNNNLEAAEKSLKLAIEINGKNSDILYSANIKLFEIAMEKGQVILERLKIALAKVIFLDDIKKNEAYKEEAKKYLAKAKAALGNEIKYMEDNFFSSLEEATKPGSKISTEAQKPRYKSTIELKPNSNPSFNFNHEANPQEQKSQVDFYGQHLLSRKACLELYQENVTLLEQEIDKCRPEVGLSISSRVSDFLKLLISPADNNETTVNKVIKESEISELSFIGLNTNYAFKAIHDVEGKIIERAQGQIISGLAALASGIAFPPALPVFGPIAGILISEGICDIVLELISQGDSEFDEAEYAKSKAISYGISIATMGIGAIASCTKIVNQAVKACQGIAKILRKSSIMKNILEKTAVSIEKASKYLVKIKIEKLAQAEKFKSISFTIQEVLKGAVKDVAISIAQEKMLTPALENILSGLKPQIKEKIKEGLKDLNKYKLKVATQTSILEATKKIISSSSLEKDSGEIAQKISSSLAKQVKNTKVKLLATASDTGFFLDEILNYTRRFCEALNQKLFAGSANNEENTIIEQISDQLTEKIFGRVVSFSSGLTMDAPKIIVDQVSTLQEKKAEKTQIEAAKKESLKDLAAKHKAQTNNDCAKEALNIIADLNKKELDLGSGLKSAKQIAEGLEKIEPGRVFCKEGKSLSKTDIKNIMKNNNCNEAVLLMHREGRDEVGHAVVVFRDGKKLILVDPQSGKQVIGHENIRDHFAEKGFVKVDLMGIKAPSEDKISSFWNKLGFKQEAEQDHLKVAEGIPGNFGTSNPKLFGGSYNKLNKEFPDRKGVTEINHIPPDQSYKGTPYANIPYGKKPAIAMEYGHHRNSKGGIGGSTSTGSGDEPKQWRAEINQHLKNGEFWKALEIDCRDTLSTTAGKEGRAYYVDSIREMLAYVRDTDILGAPDVLGVPRGRLISEVQYYQIIENLGLNHTGNGLQSPSDLNYWYKYSKFGLDKVLELRLKSTNVEDLKAIEIFSADYVFDGTANVTNGLIKNINFKGCNKKLVVLNLYAKHWVGIVLDKSNDEFNIVYIDPERNSAPHLLKAALVEEAKAKASGHKVNYREMKLEIQKYNNCGPEVIENFMLYLTGVRLNQEEAVPYHSYLLEKQLLGEQI